MRRLQGIVTLVVVAAGCNEVLGLDAGRSRGDETGGASGSAGAGGTAASGASGSPMLGGSSSTTGGDGGGSGEAGTSEGGTAGARGGRGGAGGSNSGDGGSGGPGGAGAGGGGTCSSLDCRGQGYDFCINGECVDITTDECDTILGDEWIEDDPEAEPYILGALARGDWARSEMFPSYWNLKLAMREFSEHGRILIEGEERRPVLLTCYGDEPNGPVELDWLEPLRNGLDHMVELGVSSILLFLPLRSEVQWLVEHSLHQRGDDVFFLDVGGATQSLLRIPDIADWEEGTPRRNGRLWHMLGDTYSLAFPYVPLVERIEELVNPIGTAAEPTRLMLVTGTTNEYDREIPAPLFNTYALIAPLRINGMPLADQPGQARIVSRGSLEEVAEFAPHIVLDFSGGGIETSIDEAYRARGLPPPFYILPPADARSPWIVDLIAGSPLRQIEGDPSLRTRVVGVDFASAEDPTLRRGYLERFNAIVPSFPEGVNPASSENVYDAVYFLIYGAAAGGRGGTAKAVGFQRLLLGPERHIGPDGIEAVLARLAASPDATLSLSGPSGDFPFHPPSGGRIAFGNVWCIDENLEFVMDALRYDRASNELTGTPSCLAP